MYECSKLTLDSFCKDIEFHFDDDYQGFDKPKYCELIGKNGEKVTKFGIQCDNYSVITKNHIPTFKKLVEYYLAEKKLNDVKVQIQLHKVIWDPDKRGV